MYKEIIFRLFCKYNIYVKITILVEYQELQVCYIRSFIFTKYKIVDNILQIKNVKEIITENEESEKHTKD